MYLNTYITDIAWVISSVKKLDPSGKPNDKFGQQVLGQQYYTFLTMLAASPFTAYLASHIYQQPYAQSYIESLSTGIAGVSQVIPWDYAQKIGENYFLKKGYSQKNR